MREINIVQMRTDVRAQITWRRADLAYQHYQLFIRRKRTRRYCLTFADLAFVKNFKGGMAVISTPVQQFEQRVAFYECGLRSFANDPASKFSLGALPHCDYKRVRRAMVRFAALPDAAESKIQGFGHSFTSALLHFHFPKLVPILDRRALNGSGTPGLYVDGRIAKVHFELYPALIDAFRSRLQSDPQLTLRDVDHEFFIVPMREPA